MGGVSGLRQARQSQEVNQPHSASERSSPSLTSSCLKPTLSPESFSWWMVLMRESVITFHISALPSLEPTMMCGWEKAREVRLAGGKRVILELRIVLDQTEDHWECRQFRSGHSHTFFLSVQIKKECLET